MAQGQFLGGGGQWAGRGGAGASAAGARGVINLRGVQYKSVNSRIPAFRRDHPDWGIITSPVAVDREGGFAMFSCTILDGEGQIVAVQHGSEEKVGFADYIEKAEKKAVGRALEMVGYPGNAEDDVYGEGAPDAAVSAPEGEPPAAQQVRAHPGGQGDQAKTRTPPARRIVSNVDDFLDS